MSEAAVLEAPAAEPLPDVQAAFEAALARDAQAAPPEIPAPPRRGTDADPAAPHGRDEAGEPLAPFGYNKKTGLPNKTMGGPGRGRKDRPRLEDPPKTAAAGPSGKPAAATTYAEDLNGLATTVWIGASAVQGGRLPLVGVKVPDLRPFAYLWHQESPQMAAAWAQAAEHNPAVRGWVSKLAGENNWQWVIAVGITSASFLAACTELAKPENAELRAKMAGANGELMREFLSAQVDAATHPAGPPPPIAEAAA